jgi:polysaccharide biosynthesis transport protein
MSLAQFLRLLFARRMIILVTFASCVLTALVTAFVLPPRYEARARVMLDVLKPDPVTGQVMTNNFMRAYTITQVEMIKGTGVAGRVVDQLGWANDPAMLARYERENKDPGADARLWLANQLADNVQANVLEGSNILEIVYNGPSPEVAKQMAGLIRQAYRDEALQEKRESSRASAEWYRQQADKAKKALEIAEADRTAFAKANNIVLPADNSTDVESAQLQSLGQQSVAAAAAPAMAPQINPMQAQLESVTQQLAQAASTLGPNHPTYQALLRQKQVYESLAAKQGRGGGSNAGALEGAYARQRARVIAERDKVDQLQRMQNDVVLKRDQYIKAAQRAADLQLEASTTNAAITDMGPTTGSTTPSFPNRPLILGMAAATGLGLGILLALLVELLNRRVRSNDDLEVAAGAPVLAIVGAPRQNPVAQRVVDILEGRGKAHRPVAPPPPDQVSPSPAQVEAAQ